MTQQHIKRREHSHTGKPREGTDAGSMNASDRGGSQYTCPVHPKVATDHPGDCPKNGMQLVPVGSGDSPAHDNHGHGDGHGDGLAHGHHAGILYPLLGILAGPMFTAFAMSASSLSVAMNSLRLCKVRT